MGRAGANPTGQLILWCQETPEEVANWAKSQKKKKAGGEDTFKFKSLKDIDDRAGPCMAFIKALDMKPLALILTFCTSVKK